MNTSTEKMLMGEIPRIREALERLSPVPSGRTGSFHGIQVFEERDALTGEVASGLKEGVTVTRNDRYMLAGRFIPKSEAYDA